MVVCACVNVCLCLCLSVCVKEERVREESEHCFRRLAHIQAALGTFCSKDLGWEHTYKCIRAHTRLHTHAHTHEYTS